MHLKTALEINLSAAKITKNILFFLIGLQILIAILDLSGTLLRWISVRQLRSMVNITREDSIGTWFSSTQLLVVGLILMLITYAVHRQGNKKTTVWGWAVLAFFFTYMGIDDAIVFHERVGSAMKSEFIFYFQSSQYTTGGGGWFPSYSWQLFFGPFFAAMGVFIVLFLWKQLKNDHLFRYVFFALCCYVIAVAMDFVEGLKNHPYNILAEFFSCRESTVFHLSKLIEELFEMFGTTLFLIAFLNKLLRLSSQWIINIKF